MLPPSCPAIPSPRRAAAEKQIVFLKMGHPVSREKQIEQKVCVKIMQPSSSPSYIQTDSSLILLDGWSK